MHDRFSKMTIVIAAAAVSGIMSLSITQTSAQAPAASGTAPMPFSALKTPWGEPDLQGIWTDETDTPLQRPARYANQEFFTEAQRNRQSAIGTARPRKACGARDRARRFRLV